MSDTERPKLVLTEDDFDSGPPPAAAPTGAAAPVAPAAPPEQHYPTVTGAGAPPTRILPSTGLQGPAAPFALNGVQGRSLVAATAGIALGWAICEVTNFGLWQARSESALNFTSGAWVAMLGLVFAIVYGGWEQIENRSIEGILHVARRVGPIGAGVGFVSGFIAQAIFTPILKQIVESASLDDFAHLESNPKLYLARALAWGLFGAGMGATGAALVQSREKLVNGLIGGAVGGAIGGLVFHWVGFTIDSQSMSRLIGLAVVGIGIGLAIGIVETARREAWLHVVGGGMTGKEFILYGAETQVGSDPKCGITLVKDPAIHPYHFVITKPPAPGRQQRTLSAYQGCAVTINGQAVAQHQLRSGDVIGVGATSIAYVERDAARV